MNFSGINYESLADGEGVRVSFFVSGCSNACEGCFNQEAWDFEAGQPFDEEVLNQVVKHLDKPHIAGLTILGGEPLDRRNELMTYQLARAAKELGKSVWVYTGYTMEFLLKRALINSDWTLYTLLRYVDVLVDGPFIQRLHDGSVPFVGSTNQRVIDVPQTMASGAVSLYKLHS